MFLDALHDGGIRHFDTASMPEISVVAERLPGASCYFMHPVKQRGAIRAAYEQHGVRHYVVDHPEELAKIAAETGRARNVVIIVRLATARGAAVYDLGGESVRRRSRQPNCWRQPTMPGTASGCHFMSAPNV